MENQSLESTLSAIRKSNDGVLKGLVAIGSVLEKMDARLQKQDENDLAVERAKEEAERLKREEEEKVALKSTVLKELLAELKQEYDEQLLNLGGDTVAPVKEKTSWPMGSNPAGEDKEKTIFPRNDTSKKQNAIQAQDVVGDKVVDEDEKDLEDEKDVAAEYPMEEDEYKEHPYVKSLLAKVAKLEKSVNDALELRKSLPQLIEKETNTRLQKMGFREEKTMKPRRVEQSLPTEEPVKIEKAEDVTNVIRQLSKHSYRELRQMQLDAGIGVFAGLNAGAQTDWSHYGD